MIFLYNKKIKTINAGLLLALLLFINAEKVFHKHTIADKAYNNYAGKTLVCAAEDNCSICNFQVTKDCDVTVVHIEIIKPQYSVPVYFNYTLSLPGNLPVAIAVRGPPLFSC